MSSNFTTRINAIEAEWKAAVGRTHVASEAIRLAEQAYTAKVTALGHKKGEAALEARAAAEAWERYQAAIKTEADIWIRLEDERARVLRLTAAQRALELANDPVFQARIQRAPF